MSHNTNRKGGPTMPGEQTPQFSEADVQSLGRKLAEFSQALTPGEQRVLTRLLQYALPEGSDVQGFSFDPPDYPIDRKLLVVGLLDILYPDDLGLIDSQSERQA
jgi:hypothetical protein